jgi:putative transcriptional regulator
MLGQKLPPYHGVKIMNTITHAPSLLIALPHLTDSHFRRSVVLVVEHTDEGAMGFIINRPSKMSIRDLINQSDIDIPDHIPAWFGGPVGTHNGLVLHNQVEEGTPTLTASYKDGIFNVSSSTYALRELARISCLSHTAQGLYPFRFIVGYAGWGPDQLNQEIKMGAWLQVPIDKEILFNTPWQNMWESALLKIGIDPIGFVTAPHSYLN